LGTDRALNALGEAENIREVTDDRIMQTEDSEDSEEGEGSFRRSGNFFEVTDPEDLEAAMAEIANDIGRS
jgi:hypothetical protein